jgi:hypothetical protein
MITDQRVGDEEDVEHDRVVIEVRAQQPVQYTLTA